MTDLIEDQRTADRIKTARAALKGVNNHVTDVLKHSETMADTMTQVASELGGLAEKSGDVHIPIWDTKHSHYVPKPIKKFLQELAHKLNTGAAK